MGAPDMLRKRRWVVALLKRARKWGMVGLAALALAMPLAGLAKPEPRVFKPGRYRLADGVVRRGSLCLVSDNELLVKSADTAQAKKYAAVEVQNFVMAADSFTVLRGLDVVVNEVLTRYNYAMVQVCLASPAMTLYRLEGPMDVRVMPNEVLAKYLLRGAAGGAIGMGTGILADKINNVPSADGFQEKTLTLLLWQQGSGPVLTLQPKTRLACARIKAAIADDAALRNAVNPLNPATLTSEAMLNILTQYFARAITRHPTP